MEDEAYWDSLLELEDEMRRENGNLVQSPPPREQHHFPSEKSTNSSYSRTIFSDLTDFIPISANNHDFRGEQFYVRVRSPDSTRFDPSKLTSNFDWANFGRPISSSFGQTAQQQQRLPLHSDVFDDDKTDFTPGFIDLLSDPAVNRELLGWIKEWDGFVFRRENKSKKKPRPILALLHGPPGSGKTTLVKCLAKHAGYRILEVNASDDRSIDAVKQHLDASSYKALLTEDKKPTLVMLDEIDGAPETTIKFITSLASKAKINGPVVAVANLIYGQPGFDQLKKFSRVIGVPQGNPDRLAINLASQFGIDTRFHDSLSYLAKKNNCDIRSCIQSLKLILPVLSSSSDAKAQLSFTRETIDKLGSKDSQSSGLFDAWRSVLYGDKTTNECVHWNNLVQNSCSQATFQLAVSGIFENYVEALESATALFEERLQKAIKLLRYLMVLHGSSADHLRALVGKAIRIVLGKRSMFARNRVNLSFPYRRPDIFSIDPSLQLNFRIMNKLQTPRQALVLEYMPFLLTITQPSSISGIASHRQHLNAERAIEFNRIVQLLIAFGLDYEQRDGIYKLSPNWLVHRICAYQETPGNQDRFYRLSNAMRQAIHRSIHERTLGEQTTVSAAKRMSEKPSLKSGLDDFAQCKKIKLDSESKRERERIKLSDVNFIFKKGFCNGVKYTTRVRDWI